MGANEDHTHAADEQQWVHARRERSGGDSVDELW